MPHGRFVAFEGYDTLHKCTGEKKAAPARKSTQVHNRDTDRARADSLSGLKFEDGFMASGSFGDPNDFDIEVPIPESGGIQTHSGKRASEGGKRPATQRGLNNSSVRTAIEDAISERRVLRITYVSLDESQTTRMIEPLFVEDETFYAYCRLRRDYRNFRFDGVKQIGRLNKHFTRLIPTRGGTTVINSEPKILISDANPAHPPAKLTSAPVRPIARTETTAVPWILLLGIAILIIFAMSKC